MRKADIKKRINILRDNSRNNKDKNKSNLRNPNDRDCPFRDQVCGPHCKLFRSKKKGYECPFQEITPMSWNLNKLVVELIDK